MLLKPLSDTKKKGKFYFTETTRQDVGYDIYFIPDGEWKMEYISTVTDWGSAEIDCRMYTGTHNKGVEEYLKELEINNLLEIIAHRLYQNPEFQEIIEKARGFIRKGIEAEKGQIEYILGRSLTKEEIEEYIAEIDRWYV